MFPRVSIIILNWNGWKDTIECLESLYRVDYPNYDVIVVDNGSKDDSVEKIKEYASGKIKVSSKFFDYNPENKPIRVFEVSEEDAVRGKFNRPLYEKHDSDRRLILIKNKDNYGFAGGNNIGMKFALTVLDPKHILLLNNDTVVTPSFLNYMIKSALNGQKIGAVQAVLLRPDAKTVDSLGQELSPIGARDAEIGLPYHPPGKDMEIFGACAAAALYRSEILLITGLFDESFFILKEDVDLSWRIRLNGYKAVLSHKAVVFHKRGVSGSPKNKRDALLFHIGGKNGIRVYLRYYPLVIPQGLIRKLISLGIELGYWGRKGKLKEFVSEIKTDINIRKKCKNHSVLKEIHKKWIQR